MPMKPNYGLVKWIQIVLLPAVLLTAFGGAETKVWSRTEDKRASNPSASANPELPALQAIFTVKVVATGYYAGVESTGKHPGHPGYGITYSGVKVRRDRHKVSTIAADPGVFPLGTLLYVPGYGYGIVADTGSAIKGNKIDLYFDTKRQVFSEWGKREVEVHVIRKGRGKVTEAMINEVSRLVAGRMTVPAADIR